MKKFLSILMVMTLVLSLSLTAFAAGNTGSITITNATLGEDYHAYKIFDATFVEGSDTVSYTMDPSNQFYSIFFDADGKPTAENKYFVLNTNTNGVSKAEGVNDSELTTYLQTLVNENNSFVPDASKNDVTDDVVTFNNLEYGYYVIKTTLGATVTINSNTPDVNVIDKNQIPGGEFDKSVQNGVDAHGNPVYGDSNSAGIGDTFRYKIEFVATNYDGDKQIKYYQVNDQKGDALWAEFNSFTVKVGNKELKRGYYLCLGDPALINTNDWKYLGTWTDEEIANKEKPEWYLVHLGFDQFRITIPWLENHSIKEEVNTGTGASTYTLTFPDGAKSIYDSPAKVEITYKAAVEGGAQIGGNGHNLYNEAYASWTTEYESGSTNTDRTETQVYGLGLLKDDLATGHNLANAEFRIYSDEACTKPVYVIPTDIEGVYIVDSLDKEVLTGSKMDTSRDIYEKYLAGYLGSDYETTGKQDNLLVTPVNGKVVVLGLAEGTYYLLETKAPDGYNALSTAVPFILNKDNSKPFAVYADGTGKVADIQSASGDYIEKGYQITHTVVHNSQGVELPTTGGKGTFWLITIGTILAIGFAVFLITHKKMSVYTD